jgi:hypothetical protein
MLRLKTYIFVVVCAGTMDSIFPPPTRFKHRGKKSKSASDVPVAPVSDNKSMICNMSSNVYDEILIFIMDDL